MFGKKKAAPQIDKEQLELIKNAERRIKQKKRLYVHFVIFLVGAVFLIIANTFLGVGEDLTFFGKEWFVFAILIWLFLFIFHFINVFITHNFMGKKWEEAQLEKLVAKQKAKLDQLSKKVESEFPVYSQDQKESYTETQPASIKSISENRDVTIIVAAGENNSIGKDNELIWDLPDDLQRFKRLTSGHHIIMGRVTFETFKKPLPNRTHIVITRQEDYKVPEGVIVVSNLSDALEIAKRDDQPFIIGGGEIYKQSMDLARRIEITRVHHKFDGDTFFPEIDPFKWKEVNRKFHAQDSRHDYSFSYITYERI